MKLCRYWAVAEAAATDTKGKHLRLRKWGGSNTSREDAAHSAKRALQELQQRLADASFRWRDDYSYSMRDVPEDLLRMINETSGVTRNGKGCDVLNSADVFFADIDIADPGFIARLRGKTRESLEQQKIAVLRAWLADRPAFGARVYRTRGGLRYILSHGKLPVTPETIDWLLDMGSDRLYVRLCKNQDCYRARLTPKPHRLGCARITGHFPFDDPASRARFDSWLEAYRKNSAGFAVCKFLGTEGYAKIHPAIAEVVLEHDRATRSTEDLPLA